MWAARGPTVDDQRLFRLILELEDELWARGMGPKERDFHLPRRAMQRLGHQSFTVVGVGAHPLLDRIRGIQGQLYRTKDVAIGGVHGGAFMFRGIAAQVYVPFILGKVKLDLFQFNDLSPQQVKWLRSDQADERNYFENFCDLFDFASCLSPMAGYGEVAEAARPLLRLASFQTQSAGATLCAAFDERGAIQSSLLAAELSMKAALTATGADEATLKDLGHDLEGLAEAVASAYDGFELALVLEQLLTLPKLVPNRYSAMQPDRSETGRIVMASQAVAGAVARVLTGGSFRVLCQEAAAP